MNPKMILAFLERVGLPGALLFYVLYRVGEQLHEISASVARLEGVMQKASGG